MLIRWVKPAIIISLFIALSSGGSIRNVEHSASSSVHHVGLVKELFISANDFNVAHQAANSESIPEVLVLPLQAEKLIRSNIFDYAIMFLLSLALTWFIRLIHFTSLPPRAYPSIPIAYRRLII